MNGIATFTTLFNRRNKLNKEKGGLIEISVYFDGKRKYISTGIAIEPRFWDKKRKIIDKNHPEAFKLNTALESKISELKQVELNCLIKSIPFSLDMLQNSKNNGSFTEFFKTEIESRESIKSTSKATALVAFASFEKFAGNVSFNQVNYQLISDYDNWLRKNYSSGHTVQTRHKVLKTYLNIAIKKGFVDRNDYPYIHFKLKEPKTNRIDLSFDEIEKLEKLEFKEKSMECTRDLFLFSCYTGLRYEDVQTLEPNHITGKGTSIELKKKMIKTGDEIRLPLPHLFSGKSLKILEKYKGHDPVFCLPQYANQTVNRNLKIIEHLIGFKGTLFFHLARHTFGSRLAEITSDPYLIMDLMGHKDIKTSMLYIKSSGKVIENKLKEIKWD